MSGWNRMKLGEIVEKSRGISYGVVQPGKYTGIGIPFLRVNNIVENKLTVADVQKIAPEIEENYKRSRLEGTELLITLVGSLGAIAKATKDMNGWNVARAIGVLPLKKGVNRDWVYWWLKSPVVQSKLLNIATTSVQATINLKDLSQIEVEFPDDHTQIRIGSILTSLEAKIELNHQMNHTLEQMAQALFKKYFVDDIDPENLPEGWRKMKVKELFDISIGRTPPRDQDEWFTRNGRDVKWISIRDLGNGGVYVFETSEFLTNDAVKKFNIPIIPNNTVVLSFKLTVGRVAISTERMLSNEAIAHFIPKVSPFISTEFIYLYLKNFDYNSLGNTSSIATAVNSQTIKDMEFIIPDEDTMSIFSNKVSPLFLKIKDNTTENNTLVKIRDLLLPKLMSGEVKVEQTIVTA